MRRKCKYKRGDVYSRRSLTRVEVISFSLFKEKGARLLLFAVITIFFKRRKYCLAKRRGTATSPCCLPMMKPRERILCFLCCESQQGNHLSSFFCCISQHKKDGRWFLCCDKDKQREKPVNETLIFFETKKKEGVPQKFRVGRCCGCVLGF